MCDVKKISVVNHDTSLKRQVLQFRPGWFDVVHPIHAQLTTLKSHTFKKRRCVQLACGIKL